MAGNFGTVQVGRLTLNEALTPYDDKVNANSGVRTAAISGQESTPPATQVQVEAFQDDIPALMGSLVPVTWTNKAGRNGYYQITDVGAQLFNQPNQVVTVDWTMTLARAGSEFEVDLESRLSGATARNNSFSATGERWHAPPIASYGYWSGSSQPSTVTRTGADGAVTVYRQLATNVNPRWACPPASYGGGRARFIDANSIERSGVNYSVPATGWELSNSLVRVKPLTSGGVLEVSCWSGGAWQTKSWDVLVNSVSIGTVNAVTVLRNEYDTVVVRLLESLAPGRITIDLLMRRGSRFVEIYVQAEFSSTLKLVRASTEAGTSGTGYVSATANDGAGNRYIIGSAKTFTADTTNGGLSVSSATTLDAFIGAVVGGGSAAAGDQAANLYAQYLGSPSEVVRAVRR
jgi:hypothetical protein